MRTWSTIAAAGLLVLATAAGAKDKPAATAAKDKPAEAAAKTQAAAAEAKGAAASAEMKVAESKGTSAMAAAKVAALGQAAPDFTLTDTEGNEHSLSDHAGKVVVLEWFNPDCPFVKKHHVKYKTMAETLAGFEKQEIVWLAINSGGAGKQGHGLERNIKAREDYGITYPLLLDESGEIGHLYGAKTTPHMYVIDAEGTLVYRGAIDDNRSPAKLGETNYVAACLGTMFAGESVEPHETKSYGCSVKYSSPKGAASLP